jgi:hypothetical protein
VKNKVSLFLLVLGFFLATACAPQGVSHSQKVMPTESSLSVNVENIQNNHIKMRLLTLVHRWLELVENPDRKSKPFKAIIADDIYFDFSSGAIENFEGLEAWLKGPASSVAYSKHDLSEFSFETMGENQYTIYVTMDWEGLLPSGEHMTAKTRHMWTVEDTPSETFARIKTIDVEVLKPFAVTQGK